MTDDSRPPTKPAKAALCESCADIQQNWRKAPGHPELVQGDNRQEKRRGHFATVTRYSCARCGTNWDYENDTSNLKAGWSVVTR
jgi:transposase-like protein